MPQCIHRILCMHCILISYIGLPFLYSSYIKIVLFLFIYYFNIVNHALLFNSIMCIHWHFISYYPQCTCMILICAFLKQWIEVDIILIPFFFSFDKIIIDVCTFSSCSYELTYNALWWQEMLQGKDRVKNFLCMSSQEEKKSFNFRVSFISPNKHCLIVQLYSCSGVLILVHANDGVSFDL